MALFYSLRGKLGARIGTRGRIMDGLGWDKEIGHRVSILNALCGKEKGKGYLRAYFHLFLHPISSLHRNPSF